MNEFISDMRQVFSSKKRIIFGIIILVVVLLILSAGVALFGRQSLNGVGMYKSREVSDMYSGQEVMPNLSPSASYDDKGGGSGGSLYNPPASTSEFPKDRKVIQNGSLNLLVKNADSAVKEIASVAEASKGFIENADLYEVSDGVKSGIVTVRVPADSFTTVIEAIKKIATKVSRERISTNDVTAQYVDLEAQLKNYRVEETQYQDIMARAGKIQDVLDVASRLSDVRGRIERTQGQLNYLSRQVGMSTITVSLTAEPEVQVFGIVWRPLTVLKQSFRTLLSDLAGFADWLIWFAFKLPVYVLRISVALFIFWLTWKIGRKLFRKARMVSPPNV